MLRKYFDQYSRLLSSSYCDLLFGFSAFSSWPSLEIGSYFWLQLEAEAEAKTMIFEAISIFESYIKQETVSFITQNRASIKKQCCTSFPFELFFFHATSAISKVYLNPYRNSDWAQKWILALKKSTQAASSSSSCMEDVVLGTSSSLIVDYVLTLL